MSLFVALSDPHNAYDANGDDNILVAFQGKWAPSQTDCKDEDRVNSLSISASTVTAYDFRAKLLKHAGANSTLTNLEDRYADSVLTLVAQSGEGDVKITRYRLAFLDGKLYLDYPNKTKGRLKAEVGGHVRCRI